MATLAETRILTWYIHSVEGDGSNQGPTFIADRDYTPLVVRLHAKRAPDAGEMEVDIKDDGVSIFGTRRVVTPTLARKDSEIGYRTLAVSTFRVGETITGGTSAATGRVVTDDRIGTVTLALTSAAVFSVGETITGGTSAATAVVTYWQRGYRGKALRQTAEDVALLPALQKGVSFEDVAEDFLGSAKTIKRYSLITLDITPRGASGITVQMEMESGTDDELEEGNT